MDPGVAYLIKIINFAIIDLNKSQLKLKLKALL